MKPRATVHRGVVQASALLFADQRRMVRAWEPGARLTLFGEMLLLRFAAPRPVRCADAPGLPFVEAVGLFAAMPLDEDERAELRAPEGAIVRSVAGVAEIMSGGIEKDAAEWIDASGFEAVQLEPLGEAPAPVPPALPAVAVDRARLGVPPADAQAVAMAQAIEALRSRTAAPSTAQRLISALRGFFRGLLAPPPGASAVRRPGPPTFAQRLSARIDRLLARLAAMTQLSRIFTARQAAYLRRLLGALDDNDIDEVLRSAIPLGGAASGESAPALGLPARRNDLSISLAPQGPAASMGLGSQLYETLRKRYRALFERLAQLGRIEEASFVLAELLNAASEAVDYLERHGRLRLAAELAEARGLPRDRIVRQWMLAGDEERAVAVARLHGAFAEAVAWLERTRHLEQAKRLRLHWGDTAAASGDLLTAVRAVWPMEEARALARGWLATLLARGGAAGAMAMVRQLELDPASFAGLCAPALELLDGSDAENAAARTALALELNAVKQPRPEHCVLARAAVRAMVRDGALDDAALARLVERAADDALRADLPHRRKRARAGARSIAADDRGTHALHDVALAPRCRALIAFGERGAALVTRDARTVHHFDAPAHRLVISDHGDRALALARRGERLRVTRLDLASGKTHLWGDLRLQQWADDYDGSLWFVSSEGALLAFDALGEAPRTLWRAAIGVTEAMARSPSSLIALIDEERWRYSLPDLTLRERAAFSSGKLHRLAVSEEGEIQLCESRPEGLALGYVGKAARVATCSQRLFAPPRQLRAVAKGVHAAFTVEQGSDCIVTVRKAGDETVALELRGAQSARPRLQRLEGRLCFAVCDDLGRVFACDPDSGEAFLNLRL